MGNNDLYLKDNIRLFNFNQSELKSLVYIKPVILNNKHEIFDCYFMAMSENKEISSTFESKKNYHSLHLEINNFIDNIFDLNNDSKKEISILQPEFVDIKSTINPSLYMYSVNVIIDCIYNIVYQNIKNKEQYELITHSIRKKIMSNISYVFDLYISNVLKNSNTAIESTNKHINKIENKIKDLNIVLKTDCLTGLLSRNYFNKIIEHKFNLAKSSKKPITIAYIDINNFKHINDTMGHIYGDEVLKKIANIMILSTRKNDLIFRLGGDEFSIIMLDTYIKDAYKLNARIITNLQKDDNLPSISIGCAQAGPNIYGSFKDLIKLADEQMYIQKKLHKTKC